MARWLLREIAEAKGINRYRLAKDSGLEYNTVHGIWSGRVTRVDLRTLSALARVLEIEPRDLIGSGEAEADSPTEGILMPVGVPGWTPSPLPA